MAFAGSRISPKAQRMMVAGGLAAVTIVLAVRMFLAVSRYAVNILYLDQWDFWNPMFQRKSYLDLFCYVHAHRQGLGFVLTGMLANLTGWNTRTECFMIGGVLVLALAAALALRRALFGRWEWPDVMLPVLFLSLYMVAGFVHTPNLSHGVMPLLLILLFCLCWGIRREWLRYPLLLIINFNATFTGFGVFMGVLTPALLALEAVAFWRARQYRSMAWALAALVGSIVSLLLFLHHFHPDSAIPDFKPFDQPWYMYPQFMALQMASVAGVRSLGRIGTLAGWSVLLCAAAVLAIHLRRLTAPRTVGVFLSQVIVTLIGFGLVFSAICAFGRLTLGVGGAMTLRYLPLTVVILVAIYFHFASLRRGWFRTGLLILMAAALIPTHLWFRPADRVEIEAAAQGKQQWKDIYLATGSIEKADTDSHFQIYPHPEANRLQWKLDWLKKRHLNLFLDAPAETGAAAGGAATARASSVNHPDRN